jgi:hypothetical protein
MIESKTQHIGMQPEQRLAKIARLGNKHLLATGIKAKNA